MSFDDPSDESVENENYLCGEANLEEIDSESTKDNAADEALSNFSFSERNNRSHPADDGAEHLVLREARAVRIVRVILITLLAVAATLTGIFTFRLSSRNQRDSFVRDFEDTAEGFIKAFKSGTGNQLYQTSTLSVAMSGGLYGDSQPNLPYVSIKDFDGVTASLRLQAQAINVAWSPFLRNRKQKKDFVSYATKTHSSSTGIPSGQNSPCYLCGEGMEVIPGGILVNPASGATYACAVVEQQAEAGALSATECTLAGPVVANDCGCREKSNTAPESNVTGFGWKSSDGVYRIVNGTAIADDEPGPYSPIWQIAPLVGGSSAVMFNQMSTPVRRNAINAMLRTNAPVLSATIDPTKDALYQTVPTHGSTSGALAIFFYPVFQSPNSSRIVGSLHVSFAWTVLFTAGLPSRADGAIIVLENTCGQVFTFKAAGKEVIFVGAGDLHDSAFDHLKIQSSYLEFTKGLAQTAPKEQRFQVIPAGIGCAYRVRVYPSKEFRTRYHSNEAWQIATVVVLIFIFTSCVFLFYDFIVRRIQTKVLSSAKRSEAIVSSLFPAVVRDRLFRDGSGQNSTLAILNTSTTSGVPRRGQFGHGLVNHKERLKSYLSHPPSVDLGRDPEPIADLFPNTTIMFADIAGFTAWSSEREPSQVFKLLETLYGAFDQVAKRLGVFKVETIGDSYVAVSGLPEPRKDHAVIMVRFAYECLVIMHDLTRKLESSLGPGTADLAIRVGLHSGPVIAGVLRGERARFQLFGDTMNVASRMESTGKVSQIHVSKETAQLLLQAGKPEWVEERDELVVAKGKGQLQTYWVKPLKKQKKKSGDHRRGGSQEVNAMVNTDLDSTQLDQEANVWGATNLDTALALKSSPSDRQSRLVDWNAELLQQFLQKIVARRIASSKRRTSRGLKSFLHDAGGQEALTDNVVDEVTEVINMPDFNERTAKEEQDPAMVELGFTVRSQIREFVFQISELYRDNAFHNFEHASHVAMSASKLLKRIIAPDDVEYRADESGKKLKSRNILSKEIHHSTFGISSDPLMQFAVVFSALIHDVDHTGLPNKQLVKSNDPLAVKYRDKCVAEQHSVRTAWEILMEDRYTDFRQCIYQTDIDRQRFRRLVINAVIATDIADKELQEWRKKRWDKAFHGKVDNSIQSQDRTMTDRKATIVFEYIIQASDVAHTMQHWHVYQKWNQRLFNERYAAFIEGKDDEDPSLEWYQGELWFFDNYVIPLAKNLEECNVFGVSCDEYLSYALENRNEWAVKGEQVVEEWSQKINEGFMMMP